MPRRSGSPSPAVHDAIIRIMSRHAIVALALVAACLGLSARAQQQSSQARQTPIRALYVTGGGFHDFVKQEAVLPPGISQRANVTWTIDHTAGKSTETLIDRHKDTAWTNDVDVVLYNMSFSHVVDVPWIERLAAAHRDSGVGAVILHGGVHSYRRSTTRAWSELMGAFSLRHDSQRPLTIEVIDPSHPLMRGVPSPWTIPSEELYELERTWPTMTPLAQAYSVESKKTYPVIWTNTHGKARVFVTSLGHHTETMDQPAYLDLVTRAVVWAAK